MSKMLSAALAGVFVVTSLGLASAAPGDGRGQFSRGPGQHERMARPGPGGMSGPVERVCAIDVGFQVNRMGERVATRLNLTDAQKPAMRDLQDTAVSAINAAKSLCSEKPDNSTLAGRLAYAEKVGTARLNVIKAIAPKVAAFYATLNDGQKAMFDRIGGRMERADRHGPRMDRGDNDRRREDRGHDMRRPGQGPHSRT